MAIVLSLELWKISSCCSLPAGMPMALEAEGQLRHWDLARVIRGIILPAGPVGPAGWRKLHPGILAAPSLWIPIASSYKVLVEPFTLTLAKLPAVPCHWGWWLIPLCSQRAAQAPQSRRCCRIAALRWPRAGAVTIPRRLNMATAHQQWMQSPFLSLFLPQKRQLISVCHSEWLFCWWCVTQSMEGCVHSGGRL